MRRREFITLIGGAAAWPLPLGAQQPGVPVVGFLSSRTSRDSPHLEAAFVQSLRESGYMEGQNVAIEYSWADNRYDRLPAMTAELARRQVAVIVAAGGPAAIAAKAATATIPIVFVTGVDPVASGLVAAINRPEGNATGVSVISRELNAKKLDLVHELLPRAAAIAVLQNRDNPSNELLAGDLNTVARALGQHVVIVNVGTGRELEEAMVKIAKDADAVVVTDDPFLTSQRDKLVELAANHRIVAIYPWREFVEAGGLLSYGTSLVDAFRQVGTYVGRILNGARPADLPVQFPTRFEMTINLKTARALGLDLPPMLLARADEVIE